MDSKTIVGCLFLAFVIVRLRWPRGKDDREKVNSTREWLTSSLFTFSLLGSYGLFLGTHHLDAFAFATNPVLQVLGGGFSAVGIVILEWVHRALGTHFSPHLELRPDHQIVQNGPYFYVRHPMYSCGIVFLSGTGLVAGNWIVLFLPLFFFVVLLSLRIRDEERMLSERFGESWSAYVQKTGFLFPKLK